MAKKAFKIIGIVLAVIVLAVFLFLLWNYIRIQRGDLVKWDNQWYTQKELEEKFPPQEYDVPAKNTPEQVYTKFRQALLDNDIELALEQIREESREEYREIFKNYQKENSSLKMLGKIYPDEISQNHEYGNFATYDFIFFQNKERVYSSAKFIKDQEGYWKIDQI